MLHGGILFVLGLIVGSAINSFLWRYHSKMTFKGRSMCPVCKHQISWYDNIPLASWLFLSGKCRYCKKSISVEYPLVEALTGILFAIIGLFSTPAKSVTHELLRATNGNLQIPDQALIINIFLLLLILAITTILVMIAVYDYKTKVIPNGFNLAFIISSAFYLSLSAFLAPNFIPATLYCILAAIVAFLFFYGLVYFSKERWMGGGDAKMAFGIGLLLGPLGTLLAIMIASVTGSIYGLISIAFTKRKSKNSKLKTKSFSHEIPFGPFLALGTYLAMVFGPTIIDWYVKIVLGI
jgi:leader peptidase (prepilin peptidase) / N-methyltransferase